ncbi:MAG: hypothetical protein H6813_01775 [Phycisphaeraceae bacterium]|nr:hypothetical protein [Phycisphaeraceae bacterium]
MDIRFLKVTSSNGEQRWINLDLVTRVSMAKESDGNPVLVFCFEGDDRVTIHGVDDVSRTLIQDVVSTLDSIAEELVSGALA